jgi:mannose-6-phosphate isomerase-like protein (cupin superfamily)
MNTTNNPNPNDECPKCGGAGRYEFTDPNCPECKGKGTVEVLHSHESPSVGVAIDGYSEWVTCGCRRSVECKHFRKWDKPEKYAAQSDIVRQALATPTHSLDELLRLMRRSGQAAVYLSGTRLDNEHCFGSGDVGILFSVLPQDAHAATPGYHPGSTEFYVTFQGSLVMECLEDGQVRDKTVGANEVLVLPPGQCHRVRYDARREAASVIVKTSLSAKPSVVRCADCSYYSDPTACPLSQRWSAEKKPR